MADEPAPPESIPAMRAAGSRNHGVSRAASYALVAVAVVAAGLVVLLVMRPWSRPLELGRERPSPMVDSTQAKFDAEREPAKIIAALGIGPGARVADIGANTGLLTVHLARAVQPGGKVVATDIDAGVLDLLGKRIDKAGLADVVEARVVPADKPELEPGAYDVILLSRVDNELADPAGWLAAAKAALKPDGRIVITNLLHHRADGMAAAAKAGLRVVREASPTPSYYLAVFAAK